MNMTALTAKVAEPNLPVPVQRSGGVPGEATGGGAGGASQAAPAPSAQNFGSGRSTRQLIALSLNPSAVEGPIETPAGNRRGAFAAGPQGKQDASGTPEVLAGPKSGASQGSGSGKGSPSDEGVFVGKPPEGATISPIVANNSPVTSPTSSSQRAPDNAVRDKLMAAARPPDISRQPAPGAPPQTARTVEDSAFNGKRSYQLSLSMPNLNSSTGSWIIRFAELNPSRDTTDLSAPVPTTKVDPAYPPDLLRDRVEGTVVLYAIIRADGTITDIRVLNSVQERLDASAIKALGGWKFTPGTKHGTAVDLEAIVKIPFHARRMQF